MVIAWAKSLPDGHGGCSIESWPNCSREHRERDTFKYSERTQMNPKRGTEIDAQLTVTDVEQQRFSEIDLD